MSSASGLLKSDTSEQTSNHLLFNRSGFNPHRKQPGETPDPPSLRCGELLGSRPQCSTQSPPHGYSSLTKTSLCSQSFILHGYTSSLNHICDAFSGFEKSARCGICRFCAWIILPKLTAGEARRPSLLSSRDRWSFGVQYRSGASKF